MKRNLYLLSLGVILCSCTESGDVVTGHARIIMPANVSSIYAPATMQKPTVVTTPETVISQQQPATTEPSPAPVVEQKQPVTTTPEPVVEEKPAVVNTPEPEAAPAPAVALEPEVVAPVTTPEPKPIIAQNQPITTEPLPAPAAETTPIVEQKQPVVTEPVPAAPAPKPVVEQKQPVVTTPTVTVPAATPAPQPTMVAPRSNPVSQQQPAATVPQSVNWNTPQTQPQVKRTFPIMPGQNRGLRARKTNTRW